MHSIATNSRSSKKPLLASAIALLLSLNPCLGNTQGKTLDVDWRLPTNFAADFSDIEAAIWKSVMQKAEESTAKLAAAPSFRRFVGNNHECCGGSHVFICACGGLGWRFFSHSETPKMPVGLPELFGGAENYMLTYGAKKIEFFRLLATPDNTLEVPFDFLHPSEAWNLQSFLTLDASYAWLDDEELFDEYFELFETEKLTLTPPPANYRIKFHENEKTVSVDISLLKRHVRVQANGAHSYGAKLSDFGYKNLKQSIARVFPHALLE